MATKTAPKKPAKAKIPAKPSKATGIKMSLLTAAAQILSESSNPMNAQALVDAVAKAKLWSVPNGGLTPTATLSAAIQREIKVKGKESRFKKVAAGQFMWTGEPVLKEAKSEKPTKATAAPKAKTAKSALAAKKATTKAKPKPKAKKKPAPVEETPETYPDPVNSNGTFPLPGADEPAID